MFSDIQDFLGDIKCGNVIFSFVFWISRFFSGYHAIYPGFFGQIPKDNPEQQPQKRWKRPYFQSCVKILLTFELLLLYIVVVKRAICKKTNLNVFFDVKGHHTLLILEKPDIWRIGYFDTKSGIDPKHTVEISKVILWR